MKAPRSAWIVTCLVCACGLGSVLLYPGDDDAYTRELAETRACGWLALLVLCAALCVTPLRQLLRFSGRELGRVLNPLRRVLGIAAAGCAVVHAVLALACVPGTRTGLFNQAQLRAGFAALLILVLLLATSFRPIVRTWKELHRLAYVALPLAFLHVLLGPFAPLRAALTLGAVTFAVGVLRILPARADAAASDRDNA
jgi:sulfoxide reductase heme-binding subunit YedZ